MEQPPSPKRRPRRRRWIALSAILVAVPVLAAVVWRNVDAATTPKPGSTLYRPAVDPAKLKSCLTTAVDGAPTDDESSDQPDDRLGHFGFKDDGTAEIVVLPSYRAAEEFAKLFPEPHATNGGRVVERYANVVVRTNDGKYHAKPSEARSSRLEECPRDAEVMRAKGHVAGQYTTCTKPDGGTARGLLVSGVSCKRGRELADLGRAALIGEGYGHVTMHVCCSISAHFASKGDTSVIYQSG